MKTISWILLFGLFGLMGCGQLEPPKTVQESADQLPVAEFRPNSRQRAEKSTLDDLYAKPADEVEPHITPQTISTPLVNELAESVPTPLDQSEIADTSTEEVEDMLAFLTNSETEPSAEAEELLPADWRENLNLESALAVFSQAVPVLSQALLDDDRDIRLQTVTSLTQMGEEAVPALFQASDDDDQEISTLALEMMSR